MFRGIHPEGLIGLASGLDRATTEVAIRSRQVADMLHRRRRSSAAAKTAVAALHFARWTNETTRHLRMRADLIAAGVGFDIAAMLRARFAAEGVFTADGFDEAFSAWIDDIAPSQARVNTAVANIGGWLDQRLFDWDVTNEDLHQIRTTLQVLTGDELSQVLISLTPAQLERWIEEMGHHINGFSRKEKLEVFELLATGASGTALSRVHDAVLNAAGHDEVSDLGVAIAGCSPDSTIVEFITATLATDLAQHRFSALAPGLALEGIDTEPAIAASARAILSHDTALSLLLIDTALDEQYDADQLVASLLRPNAGPELAGAFADLMALVAGSRDLGQLVAQRLGRDKDDPGLASLIHETEQQLEEVAGRLLEADPQTTVEQLARFVDPTGDLTTAYWQRVVDRGDGATVANFIKGLCGGEAVDLGRFADLGDDPSYEYSYARNLAFTAATLNLGMRESAQAAKADIDAIGRIAGVALTVAGLLAPEAALVDNVIGTAAGWDLEGNASSIKHDIDRQLAALIDTATARLRPPDNAQLSHPGAGNAMLAWVSVFTRLLPAA